jgi:hypothetical protein
MSRKLVVKNTDHPTITASGCATALLVRRNSNNEFKGYYLLSCLHLFGIAAINANSYRDSSSVFIQNHKIAEYSGLGGSLNQLSNKLWSFDAALAKVPDNSYELAKSSVLQPQPESTLHYMEDLPDKGIIHSHNREILATNLRAKRGNQLKVQYPSNLGGFVAIHRLVVKYDAQTQQGDSGSPVTSEDGSKLLGMHFAGDGGTGFMLPAVELLYNAKKFISGLNGDELYLDY